MTIGLAILIAAILFLIDRNHVWPQAWKFVKVCALVFASLILCGLVIWGVDWGWNALWAAHLEHMKHAAELAEQAQADANAKAAQARLAAICKTWEDAHPLGSPVDYAENGTIVLYPLPGCQGPLESAYNDKANQALLELKQEAIHHQAEQEAAKRAEEQAAKNAEVTRLAADCEARSVVVLTRLRKYVAYTSHYRPNDGKCFYEMQTYDKEGQPWEIEVRNAFEDGDTYLTEYAHYTYGTSTNGTPWGGAVYPSGNQTSSIVLCSSKDAFDELVLKYFGTTTPTLTPASVITGKP